MIPTEILKWQDVNIHIHKPDFFSTRIRLANNKFLFNSFNQLFQQLNLHKPGLVLDVGANYGVASLEFYHKQIGSEYVMFEPIWENCECIRETFKPLSINHTLYNCGLSDRVGQAGFDFHKTQSGTSGISSSGKGNRVIDIQTLDSYGFENVKFIKIDTEGHELEVVLGAKDTITRCQPILFYEANPKTDLEKQKLQKLLELLQSWGYVSISKSFHIVNQVKEIEMSKHICYSMLGVIKDLVAVPASQASRLKLKQIDFDLYHQRMRNKLRKEKIQINRVEFVKCRDNDVIYRKNPKTFIELIPNFFKTSSKGIKLFTKINNEYYWTYVFLWMNPKESIFDHFFESPRECVHTDCQCPDISVSSNALHSGCLISIPS